MSTRGIVRRLAAPVALLAGVALTAAPAEAVQAPRAALTAPAQTPAGKAAGTEAASAGEDPAIPRDLTDQQLTWAECYPGMGYPQFECAGLEVPKDWSRPSGERLVIAVSRVRASNPGARRGILVGNPGGPGGSGLIVSLYLSLVEPDVAAAYDLIGFDPRGVGSSRPALSCADPAILTELYRLDGRDVSQANQSRFAELNERFAAACGADPLTGVIRTDQVVRDVDLLRSVLGEKSISYIGYSAGTWLGTWYAARFPGRVDRFVLDGNLDFTADFYESSLRQPSGFQHSFESYLQPWIASYNDVYGLGTTVEAVRATYEERRAVLAAEPLTLADGSVLTAAGYDAGIAAGLYWTGAYDVLATAMSVLERYETADEQDRLLVASVLGGGGRQGNDVFWAVVCQDDSSPSYGRVVADTARLRVRYPLTGANWNVMPCPFWPVQPSESPVSGQGLPSLLMVNNDGDPATPLANALAARARTPRARLVTVLDQPDHTIYGAGDECVEKTVNTWLLDGVLPRGDVRCKGLPLPVPQAVAGGDAPSGAGALSAVSRSADDTPATVWTARFVRAHGAPRVR